MKTVLVMVMMALTFGVSAQKDKAEAYINLYKDIAIAEMQRTGVPASITLAQGILESAYGQSDLALTSNNHFGIKCKTEWTGEKTYHDDDTKQECFRVYPSVADSYKDHSNFLMTREWYAFLFKLDPTDDKGWAYGLKKAGYATEKDYPQRLLKIISDYQLQQYSLMALNKSVVVRSEDNKGLKADEQNSRTAKNTKNKRRRVINQTDHENITEQPEQVEAPVAISKDLVVTPTVALNKVAEEKEEAAETEVVSGRSGPSENEEVKLPTGYPENVFTINHTQVMYADAGLSLLSIANKFNLSLSKIYEFNELDETDILEKGQLIFLEKKLKKGGTDLHIAKSNESLVDISQKEGVRLESLMEYNKLKKDAVVHEGDKIYLRPQLPVSNAAAKSPKK